MLCYQCCMVRICYCLDFKRNCKLVNSILNINGYQVTAISPDKNHGRFFEHPSRRKIKFHNVKFEALVLEERFDCIMMIESHNYFDADLGLAQVRKLLAQGGFVLISGMFRQNETDLFDLCNIEKDYLEKANHYGLTLVQSVDITEKILPTMEFAFQAYQKLMALFEATINEHLDSSAHNKLKILRFLFLKEFRRLTNLKAYYQNRLDPQVFREQVKYIRLLFKDASNH